MGKETVAFDGESNKQTVPYQLTQKEVKLIELCRALGYGQCILYLENGQPVRAEKLKESVKF